jgi:hypothetical protein
VREKRKHAFVLNSYRLIDQVFCFPQNKKIKDEEEEEEEEERALINLLK